MVNQRSSIKGYDTIILILGRGSRQVEVEYMLLLAR